MAIALPVSNKVLIGAERTTTFTTISAKFGDGYEQIAPKGLNYQRDSWNIQWNSLSQSETSTIIAALDSVGTWGIITWAPYCDGIEKRFRLTEQGYSVTQSSRNKLWKISCSLRQIYDFT